MQCHGIQTVHGSYSKWEVKHFHSKQKNLQTY